MRKHATAVEKATGRVTNVVISALGSALSADYVPAATTLYVEDTSDFDEFGGTLEFADGETVLYTAVDDDAGTVEIAYALAGNPISGDPVYLSPRSFARYASILLADEDTDEVLARIPKSMNTQIAEGPRVGIREQELATIEYDEDQNEWLVTDLPEAPPLLDVSSMPFIGAKIYTSNNQNITNDDNDYLVTLDTIDFNTGTFDLESSPYGVTIADGQDGYYLVVGKLKWEPGGNVDGSHRRLRIKKNGSPIAFDIIRPSATGSHENKASEVFYLVGGDLLEIYAGHDAASGNQHVQNDATGTGLTVIYLGNNSTPLGGISSGMSGPQGLPGTNGTNGTDGAPGAAGSTGPASAFISFQSGDTIVEGTSQKWVAPEDFTIDRIYLSCRAAGSALLEVDILKNGSSIYSINPKPQLTTGQTAGFDSTPDDVDVLAGDTIQVEVLTVGTQTGKLMVYIDGIRTSPGTGTDILPLNNTWTGVNTHTDNSIWTNSVDPNDPSANDTRIRLIGDGTILIEYFHVLGGKHPPPGTWDEYFRLDNSNLIMYDRNISGVTDIQASTIVLDPLSGYGTPDQGSGGDPADRKISRFDHQHAVPIWTPGFNRWAPYPGPLQGEVLDDLGDFMIDGQPYMQFVSVPAWQPALLSDSHMIRPQLVSVRFWSGSIAMSGCNHLWCAIANYDPGTVGVEPIIVQSDDEPGATWAANDYHDFIFNPSAVEILSGYLWVCLMIDATVHPSLKGKTRPPELYTRYVDTQYVVDTGLTTSAGSSLTETLVGQPYDPYFELEITNLV